MIGRIPAVVVDVILAPYSYAFIVYEEQFDGYMFWSISPTICDKLLLLYQLRPRDVVSAVRYFRMIDAFTVFNIVKSFKAGSTSEKDSAI